VLETLLETKFFVPSIRPKLVSRPRLIEQLNKGVHRKFTLISAPAGFGKTTMVAEWIRQGDFLVSWLSLDDEDNDLTRFLTYFVSALNRTQGIETKIGEGALNILKSPQPPPASAILTTIINEITAIPEKIIFVFDDYHLIDNQLVNDAVAFLIENLPPQLHLVIATRQDPHLSLSRLRAQDQVTDLRAADLRFNSTETAAFLNQIMGLNLSPEDIAELETRTEGWIAGLQLAGISLHGSEDRGAFIKSFSGGHQLVLDFLIEEVLGQQPKNIQNFLLQTAILDRMTGSLCDALTGQDNGHQTLEMLDRANLFIVPLDNERHWYRYHHLFAAFLRQRLQQSQVYQTLNLYQIASKWYEQNRFIEEAIEYALRSQNFKHAVYLIESVADAVWQLGEHTKLQRWLDGLPIELVFSNPYFCIFHAWGLLSIGQEQTADRCLEVTEQVLGNGTTPIESDRFSRSERIKLQGRLAATRAFSAFYSGDIPGIIRFSLQALEYLPKEDLSWRCIATIALADAYDINDEMVLAYRTRLEAVEVSKATNNAYQIMIANLKLAITLGQFGQFQRVTEICQKQIQLANENGMAKTVVAGWILAVWGEALAEINDLERATQQAKAGIELTRRGGDLAAFGWSHLCFIRVLFSNDDMMGAEEIIQKMRVVDQKSNLPPWVMSLVDTWQARIWLSQNKVDAASQWIAERELDVNGDPTYPHDMEYIIFARTLLALGQLNEADTLLQRLFERAKKREYKSGVIEILMLQALVFQSKDETAQATTTLEQALALAKPGGFIRTFVNEGPPMARLLYDALKREIAPEYVQRLLAAFPDFEPEKAGSTRAQGDQSGLIDPLSERELEILQLISQGLTNQEISKKLFLSVHTVKTHTRNIYSKLDAHHRTEAVAKASEIGILEHI
jgi:LuxR family maltose regulon positive regulatory protein